MMTVQKPIINIYIIISHCVHYIYIYIHNIIKNQDIHINIKRRFIARNRIINKINKTMTADDNKDVGKLGYLIISCTSAKWYS